MRWCAVRDLHAGHGNRRRSVDRKESSSGRCGNPRRARRKSLSLYRIPENLRRGCAGLRIGRHKLAGETMRAYVPGYDLRVPRSLTQTLELLAREPEIWQPFAGGTDLMVLLEA